MTMILISAAALLAATPVQATDRAPAPPRAQPPATPPAHACAGASQPIADCCLHAFVWNGPPPVPILTAPSALKAPPTERSAHDAEDR